MGEHDMGMVGVDSHQLDWNWHEAILGVGRHVAIQFHLSVSCCHRRRIR